MRFATQAEGQRYGEYLKGTWAALDKWEVHPAGADPVNSVMPANDKGVMFPPEPIEATKMPQDAPVKAKVSNPSPTPKRLTAPKIEAPAPEIEPNPGRVSVNQAVADHNAKVPVEITSNIARIVPEPEPVAIKAGPVPEPAIIAPPDKMAALVTAIQHIIGPAQCQPALASDDHIRAIVRDEVRKHFGDTNAQINREVQEAANRVRFELVQAIDAKFKQWKTDVAGLLTEM